MAEGLRAWVRKRRVKVSAGVLAVLVSAPVTLAVIHEGFPISDVDLNARDVWVTNNAKALTGRLNMQIRELNGGVAMASADFDVLQDGTDVFVIDRAGGSIERVDPAYTTLGQRIDVPADSSASFGGGQLAITAPDGDTWSVNATGELQFDPFATPPVIELGRGGSSVVTAEGMVLAASAEEGALYRIDPLGDGPDKVADLTADEIDITAVGERAVILDRESGDLIFDDGSTVNLPSPALRLQQPGAARDFVVVATADGLLRVGFDKSVDEIGAQVSPAASGSDEVSAPVVLGPCVHGAWASATLYVGVCEGEEPRSEDIPGATRASTLEFRVNRDVIALNNIDDGNVWLVTENMTLVDNWEEVTPPQEEEGEEGEEKASQQSFEDTLNERTDQNRPPVARNDSIGVRPGKTTIFPILDNDTDPDGDVLTISTLGTVAETAGVLQLIDDGRALQFVPAPGAAGTVSFRYSVSDGRPGGVAEAQVDVAIRPLEVNEAPLSHRISGTSVEAGQTINYNLLTDWHDPDGDDLTLVGAVSTTGDLVRFTPDGLVTFTNISSEHGTKSVTVTLSDGQDTTAGELIVEVKPRGALNPVGTPDFAAGFVGRDIEVKPLDNDVSPSGDELALTVVEPLTEGGRATTDVDRGTVTVSAPSAGTYYFKYTLQAGAGATSIGLIRVDVDEDPEEVLPPIAVKDTAYLRPEEPMELAALINDASPSGRVIGIQSIDLPGDLTDLSVEVLSSTVLRITGSSAITSPVEFTYTISDGVATSTAGVTVVPVPELTRHQAPIAKRDTMKVRAGDIASIPVLDNDYHPDGARMELDPELVEVQIGDDGLAFVTGDNVRVQAPSEPGQYRLAYRVFDRFGEEATADVILTVIGPGDDNQPPQPRPLTARVFQGSALTVEVPLSGIDPDGDSVVLVAVSGQTLGEVTGVDTTAFTYQAYPDSAGTDTFTYQVRDALGETATGEIQIGVIDRGDTVLPPTAVDDEVAIRPGRVAQIPVLANDSDPNNYKIHLDGELLEVNPAIQAKTSADTIIVTASDEEGTFEVQYQIDNGEGGTDTAFLLVTVSPDAPISPPVAIDQVVEPEEVIGEQTVVVDVYRGAQNTGGVVDDLVVTVEGPNADIAEVLEGGKVRVTLGDTRQAVAFRLTNEVDELSAMAFIVVPRFTDGLPPHLRDDLEPQLVDQDGTIEWQVDELVEVPSGRPAIIIRPGDASAGRSNGEPIVIDETTLRYTPEAGFRGTTAISFIVTDGTSETDPSGQEAPITFNVTVGDPEFRDYPPAFSNTSVQIEAGEAPRVVDLRASTSHPNPAVIDEVRYGAFTGATSQIAATPSGSTLSLSSPFGVQPGTTAVIRFVLTFEEFEVPGQIEVTVVPSTRPLAQAVADVEPDGRSSSSYTIQALANDYNPFAGEGEPLRIVDAQFESGGDLGASLSRSTSTVTVDTGTAKSGTISVIYTIRDATDTASREVQGRITINVASAPEPITSISLSNPGSQTVHVVFQPPVSNNGADISGYTVRITGSPGATERTDCVPGATCVLSGRTNGEIQTIEVAATNRVGTTWSSGRTITPYGTPAPPASATASNGPPGGGYVNLSWAATPDVGGGQPNYQWRQLPSGGWNSTGTGRSAQPVIGAGNTASFEVRVCNAGSLCSSATTSNQAYAPPRTDWGLTANEYTCPEPEWSPPSNFSGGCNQHGSRYVETGRAVSAHCYTDSGFNVDGYSTRRWYLFDGDGYSGWWIFAPHTNGDTSGMPAC